MPPSRESVIFDDVITTSTLHSDKQISKANFTCFSRTYYWDNARQHVVLSAY